MNKYAWLTALIAVSLFAFGCGDDNDTDQGMDPMVGDDGVDPEVDMGMEDDTLPILAQLAAEEECTALAGAVDLLVEREIIDDGLLALLAAQPGLTVFCPSNEAIAAALPLLGIEDLETATDDQLTSLLGIIAYHIVPSFQDAAAIVADEDGKLPSLLGVTDGAPGGATVAIYVNTEDGVAARYLDPTTFMEAAATVTEADVAVEGDENAIIHKVNAVILPPGVTAVAIFEGLTPLVGAVLAAADPAEGVTLAAFLSNPDPAQNLTVFAPSNAAMTAGLTALNIDLNDIQEGQPEALLGVLTYHVVARGTKIFSSALPASATTVAGLDLTFEGTDINGGSGGGGATIEGPTDIQAANGVIHIIDAVLLPPVAD